MSERARPVVLGHRGSSLRHRQNTLEAFTAAITEGADGVELDVRRAADRSLPVHHDAALADGREIVDLDRAGLPDWVPELDAVLDACAGARTGALVGALVNIEIKVGTAGAADTSLADDVVALLQQRSGRDRVLVSCFEPAILDRVLALDGDLETALLATAVSTDELRRRAAAGDRAVHPESRSVTAEFVAAAHQEGLRVNVWTVNDPDRIAALAEIGADGIITDDPAGARAALAAVGAGTS